MKRIAITICNFEYMHYEMECESSFVGNNSREWIFVIVLVDYPAFGADQLERLQGLLACPSSVLITIPEIFVNSREVSAMSLYYDITEYSTSVKPWVFSYLLARYSPSSVTYIDPDIQLFGCLESHGFPLKGEGFDCVVTPHVLTNSLNSVQNPTLQNIRACGSYNFGFVHFENTLRAGKVIDFWKKQLVYDSLNWHEENLFTDQRFGDLFPSMCRVHVNRSPALNVAYWNMQERLVYWHCNGKPHVRLIGEVQDDGAIIDDPLIFFHFSGFRASGFIGISKYGGRDPLSPRGGSKAIEKLVASYEALTKIHRARLLDLNLELPPDLIGALSYRGIKHSNYYRLSSTERRDLNRFLATRANSGMPILPPSRFVDEDAFLRALHGISSYPRSGVQHEEFNILGAIGLSLPDIQFIEAAVPHLDEESKAQLNIIGYPNFSFGVGRITGLILRSLNDSGICFSFTIDPAKVVPILDRDLAWVDSLDGLRSFNSVAPSLFLVNADQLLYYVNAGIADQYFSRVCNLGYWWWELECPTPGHAETAKYLDKVLAPTKFIFDSLAQVLPCEKLIYAPLNYRELYNSIATTYEAPEFCSSDQDFLYSLGLELDIKRYKGITLSVFDFRSCIERKNPYLLIELFSEPGMEDQALVLKSSGGTSFHDQYLSLIERIAPLPNVFLLNANIPQVALQHLFRVCNVYASPHRSEGLGLNIIEADALGLSTVFTDYGGITEYPFFGGGTHQSISFSLVKMSQSSIVYQPYLASVDRVVNWAEPDFQSFRQALRQALRESGQAVGPSEIVPTVSKYDPQALTLADILKDLIVSNSDASAVFQPFHPLHSKSIVVNALLPTLIDVKPELLLSFRKLVRAARDFFNLFIRFLYLSGLALRSIIRHPRILRRLYKALVSRLRS
jgi:hypothetical protein